MDENEQTELKPVSIQKLEANRRNALHSTGPKTPEGKANVRLNALKHGFLSKQIVISSKAIGEDPREFEALLENLQQHHQPADNGGGAAGGSAGDSTIAQFWRWSAMANDNS